MPFYMPLRILLKIGTYIIEDWNLYTSVPLIRGKFIDVLCSSFPVIDVHDLKCIKNVYYQRIVTINGMAYDGMAYEG